MFILKWKKKTIYLYVIYNLHYFSSLILILLFVTKQISVALDCTESVLLGDDVISMTSGFRLSDGRLRTQIKTNFAVMKYIIKSTEFDSF